MILGLVIGVNIFVAAIPGVIIMALLLGYIVNKSKIGEDTAIGILFSSLFALGFILLSIYDTMQFVKPSISTMCIGQAASMGALLLAGGDEKKRFALPNSRIMIHQPLGGFQGQASDFEIHAKEILHMKKIVNEILAKHTGQTIKKIEKDTDRDNFLDAKAAKTYGIIDNILEVRNS